MLLQATRWKKHPARRPATAPNHPQAKPLMYTSAPSTSVQLPTWEQIYMNTYTAAHPLQCSPPIHTRINGLHLLPLTATSRTAARIAPKAAPRHGPAAHAPTLSPGGFQRDHSVLRNQSFTGVNSTNERHGPPVHSTNERHGLGCASEAHAAAPAAGPDHSPPEGTKEELCFAAQLHTMISSVCG